MSTIRIHCSRLAWLTLVAPPAGAAVLHLHFGVDVGLPVFVAQFAITFWLMIATHELGNLAAGVVVEKPGTATAFPEEIMTHARSVIPESWQT